jgi:hypothetical protein
VKVVLSEPGPLLSVTFLYKRGAPESQPLSISEGRYGVDSVVVYDGDLPPNRPKRFLSGAGYGAFERVVQGNMAHV